MGVVAAAAYAGTGTKASAPLGAQAAQNAQATCVQTATARARAAAAPKKFVAPGPAYKMKQNAGKTIWVISLSLAIPFNANEAKGAEEAAKAAGLKVKVFDGKGAVTTWNAGVAQAVAQGADGILLQGIDPKLVSGPLLKAKAKGIPVIDAFTSRPNTPFVPGVVGHVTADYSKAGAASADWILMDSKCTANTQLFGVELGIEIDNNNGFKNEYKSLCPKCKLNFTLISDLAHLDTQLFSSTQSALRRDPGINYIWGDFDGMVTFILPAVEQQAKGKVKIVSHDGIPENLKLVRQGKQAADGALPPLQVVGWAGVDQLGRAMLKLPLKGWVVPDRLVDRKTIPKTDAAIFATFSNYKGEFKKLWAK
jgi:ABC-type sugar transport system substrate-binding protein